MPSAAIALRRRPFLAPIWLAALLAVVAAVIAFEVYQSATTTTIVVVEPAESALGSIQDAPLMLEGEQRAEHLAQLFGGTAAPGRIVAIYAASTRQTQQTAAPLAARLGIQPIVVSAEDLDGTVSRVLSEHRGQAVMIVSGAAWRLVGALTGAALTPPPADDYGNIYIVSVPAVGSAGVVHLRY